MTSLKLLSGGAAQGLVAALKPIIEREAGVQLDGAFGAVGTMAAKLREGTAADLLILTPTVLAQLERDRLVDPSSYADIGGVETSIAVRAGDAVPALGDAAALRATFLTADAVYLPDLGASTAGIHAIGVIERLGIRAEIGARLRVFPNGATAMRELATSTASRPIGCTQTTEILSTEGVALVAPLPKGFGLATVYRAAVVAGSAEREAALRAIGVLTAAGHAELRARLGFSPSPSRRG